ncbi:unnamed protein product, partial [Ectocarpus sp. 12 AP-2014]
RRRPTSLPPFSKQRERHRHRQRRQRWRQRWRHTKNSRRKGREEMRLNSQMFGVGAKHIAAAAPTAPPPPTTVSENESTSTTTSTPYQDRHQREFTGKIVVPLAAMFSAFSWSRRATTALAAATSRGGAFLSPTIFLAPKYSSYLRALPNCMAP